MIVVVWNKCIDSLFDVFIFVEVGLKDVNDLVWYGFVVLVGMLDDIICKFNEVLVKVLKDLGLVD